MIAYEIHGGRGPDIVLLHGVGLDAKMWHRCLPRLTGQFRVTSIDLRGHGRSPAATPGLTLADLSSDVAGVLDQISALRAHLVGFSLGALVAQQLALAEPQRVQSLTLVSSVADRSTDQRAAVTERLRLAAEDRAATVQAAIDRWFSQAWRNREPELVEQVRRTMLGADPASYLACYQVFATADAQLWPQLPQITCPTLVVTGAADTGSTPEMTHRIADAISDAKPLVFPDTGHLLPLERPFELSQALIDLIERSGR